MFNQKQFHHSIISCFYFYDLFLYYLSRCHFCSIVVHVYSWTLKFRCRTQRGTTTWQCCNHLNIFFPISYFIWKSFLVVDGQAQTGGVGHGTKKRKSNWNADIFRKNISARSSVYESLYIACAICFGQSSHLNACICQIGQLFTHPFCIVLLP